MSSSGSFGIWVTESGGGEEGEDILTGPVHITHYTHLVGSASIVPFFSFTFGR
jgi:hypothetical protein